MLAPHVQVRSQGGITAELPFQIRVRRIANRLKHCRVSLDLERELSVRPHAETRQVLTKFRRHSLSQRFGLTHVRIGCDEDLWSLCLAHRAHLPAPSLSPESDGLEESRTAFRSGSRAAGSDEVLLRLVVELSGDEALHDLFHVVHSE